MDDYALLGIGKATSLIEHVHIDEGNGVVVLSCLYDPQGVKIPYKLLFKGCRVLSWETYPLPGEQILPADLMGISLGADKQRKPAVITTDTFELSFLYDNFILERS